MKIKLPGIFPTLGYPIHLNAASGEDFPLTVETFNKDVYQLQRLFLEGSQATQL